ncbi:MAG: hypothetical protein U0359_29085 [Byssovorax sp.]
MAALRNLKLIPLYLMCSLEGVCYGVYWLWLTAHRGISPIGATAGLPLAAWLSSRLGLSGAAAALAVLGVAGWLLGIRRARAAP